MRLAVTTDWRKLEMEFVGPDGKKVLLRGMQSYPPQTISAHRMEADLRHGDIKSAMELRISETRGKPNTPHPKIQTILDRYPVVFGDMPPSQPPNQRFEHMNELESGV